MTGRPGQTEGRAAGGHADGSALGSLWHEHRRWVAAVLLAHMPRQAELEDLLQEVAVAFVSHVHELRDPGALRPWLRTVAVNVARMEARGHNRRLTLLRPLGEGDQSLADPAGEEAHALLETRAEAERALTLLAELPPEYREPLTLRCVQGLSQRRIAETLGLPETTIETRLARGRRLLRERLAAPVRADVVRPSGSLNP